MLPNENLHGSVLIPGTNQSNYYKSGKYYDMVCDSGFENKPGKNNGVVWRCEEGEWVTTAECKGK